jgi:hypothetical protein
MSKAEIMQHIIAQLSHDLEVLYTAAKTKSVGSGLEDLKMI